MSRRHVAIVGRDVLPHLRSGRKRIETRLTRQPRPPFGCVRAGDAVHFKLSGGAFVGSVRVLRVRQLSGLTPGVIRRLRQRHGGVVCAPRAYWESRRAARFAVLIWIGRLRPCPRGLSLPRQHGNAWVVLD